MAPHKKTLHKLMNNEIDYFSLDIVDLQATSIGLLSELQYSVVKVCIYIILYFNINIFYYYLWFFGYITHRTTQLMAILILMKIIT